MCEPKFRRHLSAPSSCRIWCTLFSCSADFRPWRWMWHLPPKRRFTFGLHGATYHWQLSGNFLEFNYRILFEHGETRGSFWTYNVQGSYVVLRPQWECVLKILLMLKLKFAACGCRQIAFVSLCFRASERPYKGMMKSEGREKSAIFFYFRRAVDILLWTQFSCHSNLISVPHFSTSHFSFGSCVSQLSKARYFMNIRFLISQLLLNVSNDKIFIAN
jgi:hypothetical protein